MGTLNIGEQIDDHLILELRGEGAFGSVYKAQNLNNSNYVALKLCKTNVQEHVDRFRDENQMLRTLYQHKNIVDCDSSVVDTTIPHIYYTMELADSSLDQFLIKDDRTNERKIEIFTEICEGLKHAHDHQIIHRDLHWENVLIVNTDKIKINDFGRGRSFDFPRKANSIDPCWGRIIITPPELKFNIPDVKSTDIKNFIPSDIYALGIILYYLFEIIPGDYVIEINNSIDKLLVRNNINLNNLNITERSTLYQNWITTFIPQKKLIVNSINDDKVNKNVNEIIAKATRLDFNSRYQNIDEILIDIKKIFL